MKRVLRAIKKAWRRSGAVWMLLERGRDEEYYKHFYTTYKRFLKVRRGVRIIEL